MYLSEDFYFQHQQLGCWYLSCSCLKDMILCRHLQEETNICSVLQGLLTDKQNWKTTLCSSPIFKEDLKATILEKTSIPNCRFWLFKENLGTPPSTFCVVFAVRDPAMSPADSEAYDKHSLVDTFLLVFQSKSMFTLQLCRLPRIKPNSRSGLDTYLFREDN